MIHVEKISKYSQTTAIDLGLLRPYLSTGASPEPVNIDHLKCIISSSDKELLVARINNDSKIVGTATLNIISGALSGDSGYLMDFVTDPEAGIKGIGQAIWNEMESWCKERNIDLIFTSRATRVAAHNFYKKQGAQTLDTDVFKKTLST